MERRALIGTARIASSGRLRARIALACASLAFGACASGTARDDAPPPRLETAYPLGSELRFRRVVTSSAHNRELAAEGRPDGVEFRVEIEFAIKCGEIAGAAPQLRLRPTACAFETTGLQGEMSFDTRDPDSLRALEAKREGAATRRQLETVLGTDQNFELSADGVPGGGLRSPVVPFGPRDGSLPGMLPFGDLSGTGERGASFACDGVLRVGHAGLRYDDALTFRGTWTVAAWNAHERTARLVLTGATSFDDRRLRTTRVVGLELGGEAVWDAERRLVIRSSVTTRVVLSVIEVPTARIDWKMTFEDELLPR